jgi:hypothetical protein
MSMRTLWKSTMEIDEGCALEHGQRRDRMRGRVQDPKTKGAHGVKPGAGYCLR